MKRITPIIILAIAVLLPPLATAQKPKEFRGQGGSVHITSHQMEADHRANLITFKGNVVARQKEFVLYADRLFLFTDKQGEDITKILARGHVRIVQGERTATCQEATYYHRESKVILRGKPMVQEGNNQVHGKRIIYYIDEQRSVAEGEGDERVTVTIIPGEVKK